MNLTKVASRYELAAARWPDEPAFRRLLAWSKRDTREALLYGVDKVGEASVFSAASVNYPGAGYAILARGAGRAATWLCLKYSPSCGYHDHPDRLGFILYARGKIIAPDPGSRAYGLALQREWYKTTLAHSTLMVDGKSQERKAGKCLAFGTEKGMDFVVLDAGAAIPGVRFIRTAVLLDENRIVFIDQVRADRERQLDFVYHQAGKWAELPPGKPWTPPDSPPYRHLRNTTIRPAGRGLLLFTDIDGVGRVAIVVAGGDPAEAITGTGPGVGGVQKQNPCLILRRRATHAGLAWAVALDGRPPKLEWRSDPAADTAVLELSRAGKPPLVLRVNPDDSRRPLSIRP